jgi:hypothetical protein
VTHAKTPLPSRPYPVLHYETLCKRKRQTMDAELVNVFTQISLLKIKDKQYKVSSTALPMSILVWTGLQADMLGEVHGKIP